MSFLLRIPMIVGIVWLIIQIKPFKNLTVKKKWTSIIIIGFVFWGVLAAVQFEYNIFTFKTPEMAIKYNIKNLKPFKIIDTIDNGIEGTYVIIENQNGYDSYYLEKINDKWRMPKHNPKINLEVSGYNSGVITYLHYLDEGIVTIEYLIPFTTLSSSNNRVADNKGTIFQSHMYPSVSGKVDVLFYGLYSYDNLPYEFYLNGETAFAYIDE